MASAGTEIGIRTGKRREGLIRALKIGLPLLIGLLVAFLALAPLSRNKEISFLLDKNKVETAEERMRVQSARYQGQDDKGRPFEVAADQAVQVRSSDPTVNIQGIAARILLNEGPATMKAERGQYNLDEQTILVPGPIQFTAHDGFELATRDVTVDLNTRQMTGSGRVEGQMPLGRFSADKMTADLGERRVTLTGRARLHIEQGALR